MMDVRDLMTRDVVAVPPETPLKQVAALLVEHRISGVPIVDPDWRVLGVVSEADFVELEDRSEPDGRRPWLTWLLKPERGDRARHRVDALTAGEIMSAPAHTIGADRSAAEAVRTMVANRVKRLPVVDGERLVGIVTRSDLIRSYLRSDAEITVTVERAVRAVDGLQVVGVQDGVVKLGGTVASRALAGAIRHLVSEIDGVVAVDDGDLNWPDGWPSEVVRQ